MSEWMSEWMPRPAPSDGPDVTQPTTAPGDETLKLGRSAPTLPSNEPGYEPHPTLASPVDPTLATPVDPTLATPVDPTLATPVDPTLATPVDPAAISPVIDQPPDGVRRGVRVRTMVYGAVMLVISVVTLLALTTAVHLDGAAIGLTLLLAAGAALVAGGAASAVREARGGPGAGR